MDPIEWKDEYSVKVKIFDEHHQQLIKIINQLSEAVEGEKSQREMDIIFAKLIEYTQIHFDSEESVLAQYHYPGLQEQQREHNAFVETLRELRGNFKSDEKDVELRVLCFLQNWLITHILESDQEYSSYLNEKGVE